MENILLGQIQVPNSILVLETTGYYTNIGNLIFFVGGTRLFLCKLLELSEFFYAPHFLHLNYEYKNTFNMLSHIDI